MHDGDGLDLGDEVVDRLRIGEVESVARWSDDLKVYLAQLAAHGRADEPLATRHPYGHPNLRPISAERRPAAG